MNILDKTTHEQLENRESVGSKTYKANSSLFSDTVRIWKFKLRTNPLTEMSSCGCIAPFLCPSSSLYLPHGTTSHSTIQFAAIVYNLWVNFIFVNFPSEKDSHWLNLYLTHTVDIFLEEKWFYFRFIFCHFFVLHCWKFMYVYIFDLNFQGINHVAWVSFFLPWTKCDSVLSWDG